jgi:hypothetical protein
MFLFEIWCQIFKQLDLVSQIKLASTCYRLKNHLMDKIDTIKLIGMYDDCILIVEAQTGYIMNTIETENKINTLIYISSKQWIVTGKNIQTSLR